MEVRGQSGESATETDGVKRSSTCKCERDARAWWIVACLSLVTCTRTPLDSVSLARSPVHRADSMAKIESTRRNSVSETRIIADIGSISVVDVQVCSFLSS